MAVVQKLGAEKMLKGETAHALIRPHVRVKQSGSSFANLSWGPFQDKGFLWLPETRVEVRMSVPKT